VPTSQTNKMAAISALQARFLTGIKARTAAHKTDRISRAVVTKPAHATLGRKAELPKAAKPLFAAVLSNALTALPSLAGEPGKIFDFNLTLPIIAAEFLLLMVILDKTVFGPVGKALDDRDALIRSQLEAVGDNSTEVANLIAEKEAIISNARAEVSKEVASTKAKIDTDIAAAQAKAKADVDTQIAAALAKLDAAKAESASQVETKAKELSDQIIKKVVEV